MNDLDFFTNCMFFNSARLFRLIEGISDEEFSVTGLSSSHAFIVMAIFNNPGITPMKLGEMVRLAPSTVTRLVDKIEQKGLVERKVNGRNSCLTLTDKGKSKYEEVIKAWDSLYSTLTKILGKNLKESFAADISAVCKKLEE